MKKILTSKIFLSLLALILVVFVLAGLTFSPLGNYFIQNALLAKLESHTQMQWKSRHFRLTPSHITLDFSAQNDKLELFLEGDYSLFLRTLKGNFLLNSQGFQTSFKNQALFFKENQWVEGEFEGEFSNYTLHASSNLLDSQSDFVATLHYLSPKTLTLNLKNGSLASLLGLFGEKPYSDGILSLNANLTCQSPTCQQESLSGTLNLEIEGGELERNLFLSEFNLAIPNTSFMGELDASLHQNAITHNLKIYSTIGDALINGTTNIHSLATNTNFQINLTSLSPISPFFKIPLNGAFGAKGVAKGDFKNMLLDGEIQLSNSPLNYNLNLQNLKPKTLKITSQNLKAQSLFRLLNQNPYFEGDVNLAMDLRDFSQGISGVITLSSQNLFINSPLLEEKTHIGFPSSQFAFDSKIELANGSGILNYSLQSNLLKLQAKNGNFTLKPFDFSFPTTFEVSKLQNLSYRNKTALQGSLTSQGTHTKDSFELQGTLHYNQNQNPFSLRLTPQNFTLRIQQIPSSQIYTLFDKIPRYFSGVGNFSLNNDFANHINNINFDIHSLAFQPTPLLQELQSRTKQNLAKESFNGYIYNTILQNKTLQSRIQLQSNRLKIQSQKITTNLATKELEGEFMIQKGSQESQYSISGKASAPRIKPQIKPQNNPNQPPATSPSDTQSRPK